VHYYFSDHLGTHGVVENATGTTCEQDIDYYPYGGIEHDYCPNTAQNYKFTGKERDAESGLDYFGARHNASSIGRFMSVDPVKVTPGRMQDPQQFNLYSYVRNNPLRYVDPDGETLRISGDVNEALKQLCLLLGGDCGRLSYDAATNTITVDLSGINLDQNEGASLLSNVVGSGSVYNLDLGSTMLTAGGLRSLAGDDSIQNLDNKADWRYGKGKSAKDKPPPGVDDQIGINPKDAVYRDSKGHIVPLSSMIFHELAEAYAKIDGGKQYVNKDGSAGAHDEAAQRELTLRRQRPYMKMEGVAGDPVPLIREPKQ
jgi:RHS repeat-associated protein